MMVRRLLYPKSTFVKIAVAIMVSAFALVVFVGVRLFVSGQGLLNDTENLLSDYSDALSTGQITHESHYAPMMKDLIRERRSFYGEYFEVGLYSRLEGITSEFGFEPRRRFPLVLSNPSIVEFPALLRGKLILVPHYARLSVLSDDQLSIQVTEVVTLYGKYKTPPEESPLVLAARWALARTDDEAVKQELKRYLDVGEDTRESFGEGFETVLVVRHSLVVARTQNGLQIVRDTFTNQTESMPGMDNVSWVDGHYVRNKPDFTEMLAYRRHAMSTEELGRKLLDTLSRVGDR